MTDKHELDINEEVLDAEIVEEESSESINEETVEDAVEVAAEENVPVEETEESVENSEEDGVEPSEEAEEPIDEMSAKEEIISEFAPAPIKIPNYNKEREKAKVHKAKVKSKKAKSKKARRRKRMIRKTLLITRNIFLFIFLLVVATATVASLLVRMNTTETAVEKAIRNAGPETFIIGKIDDPEELDLVESSPNASVADIIRDNCETGTTYKQIEGAVNSSAYPKFVSRAATNVINYYVYGEQYKPVTEDDIKEMLSNGAGYLNTNTVAFGQTKINNITERIAASEAIGEISQESLNKQKAVKLTSLTSVMFSSSVLIFLVVALLLLTVITIIYCRDYWHKILGTAIILGGLLVAVLGFLFKPAFVGRTPFVRSVVEAITNSFNTNALIYGAIAILIGALVVFIGKSMSDDDDDEYYYEPKRRPRANQ